jgi:hypothetical protein
MDVLAAGFALGVGVTWLARRGRTQMREALAWTARQSGWISGRVSANLAEASRVAREQYASGRASVRGHDVPASSHAGESLGGATLATSTLNGGHSAVAPATGDLASREGAATG